MDEEKMRLGRKDMAMPLAEVMYLLQCLENVGW